MTPVGLSPKRLVVWASALLLGGLITGSVAHFSEKQHPRPGDPRTNSLSAAQTEIQKIEISRPPTTSPARTKCCKEPASKAGGDSWESATATVTQDPEEKTGLPLGHVAPDFILPDQNGNKVSLDSLLKKGPVAVVFHRSVHWCLYCKLQMVQLQRIHKEIEAAGGQVVAISYDPVEKIEGYAKRSKITFPLLSDVGSKIIDAYDIRYKEAPPETSGFARHATFVIDQKGVIRAKLFRLSYQERPAINALINALKEARDPTGGARS
jgi:peroxiredoxin